MSQRTHGESDEPKNSLSARRGSDGPLRLPLSRAKELPNISFEEPKVGPISATTPTLKPNLTFSDVLPIFATFETPSWPNKVLSPFTLLEFSPLKLVHSKTSPPYNLKQRLSSPNIISQAGHFFMIMLNKGKVDSPISPDF